MNTALSVLLFFLAAGLQPVKAAHAQPAPQVSASDLIAEVNALRISNGLPTYTVSAILMQTAQGQADYMAATGSITHSGPGGISLTQRLLNAGYPLAGDLSLGGFRAENITGGSNKTAAQAVQEWTGDAPHLNTMLSPNLQEIGAGVAKVGSMVYLVIDCARPTTGGQVPAYTPAAGESAPGTFAPSDFMVPVVTNTPDQDGLVYHEVQYGQTLWSLAIGYGVKIDEIRALNNLGEEETIYQGERLLIRKDTPPVPTPSPITPLATDPAPAATASQTAKPSPETAVPAATTVSTQPGLVSNSTGGLVVGIALLVILLAGLLSRRHAVDS